MDIDSLSISGKTIIILCGNNTKDPIKAGSYAANCFNWLRECNEAKNTTIYSIYYPKNQPLIYGMKPNFNFDYDALAETIFKPLFYKNGKILAPKDIVENLSGITFFGHSVGGYVMDELMYALRKVMYNENFSIADMNKVYSSIVFVGYSPFKLIDAPINNIYFAPIYDSVGSVKLAYEKIRRRTNIDLSSSQLTIDSIRGIKAKSYSEFIEMYKQAVKNEDVPCFKYRKTIIATPDLLFDDWSKEDHKLAGIVDYHTDNPYQTQAGKKATQLMKHVLKYSITTERSKFSIDELYQQVLEQELLTSETDIAKKEL